MGDRMIVQIDVALVHRMRAIAIADDLPDAGSIPDEALLAALIRAEVGEEAEPVVESPIEVTPEPVVEPPVEVAPEPVTEPPLEVTPKPVTLWVNAKYGLNLRTELVAGEVMKILADREELTILDRQEDWLEVRTADGLTGWVLAKFVSEARPIPPVLAKGNVRGIHGAAGAAAPPRHLWDAWIAELKAMGMAWYKQLDAGDPNDVGGNSTFDWVLKLKRNGIEPIVRFVQGQMFPGRLRDLSFEKMKRYASEEITWCEIGNEPNLDRVEWHSDYHGKVSWQDPFYPRVIVENWLKDAEKAVAAGARPGFYAFAPTDWGTVRPHPRLSSVMFYRRMFEHVAANPDLRQRFCDLFESGKAWLAVHVAIYELPFVFDPFPPNEFPYDMCLRGYEVPLRYLRELLLGDTPVTVMSTEGGVFTKDSLSMEGHPRLRSDVQHAQRTVGMFHWIQKDSPLQAMCPWLISNVYAAIGHTDQAWADDGWYDGGPPDFKPKPVVDAMKNTGPAS